MTGRGLEVHGLRIGYHGRMMATVPDRRLTPDRIWLVTGPNGSGKTTLLKTLAGLLPPVAGTIVPAPLPGRHGCVFVHSTPFLFRGTVRSNLALGTSSPARLLDAATRFELTNWLDRPVHELSHGMRQRTAIARAVVCDPRVLLLDEPEGGLDDRAIGAWRGFLTGAIGAGEMTIVVAAHRPGGLDGVPVEDVGLSAQP